MEVLELADVCELVTDGTHYTPPDIKEGVPFLTVKDINSCGELDFVGSAKISEEEFKRAAQGNSSPVDGDVLFSKDGTVGKVSVVLGNRRFAVLSSIAILRPKKHVIDSAFLGHALRSRVVLDQALKKKTGSAIRRIILADLKSVRLLVPDLTEQRRIVAILDKADALRATRREAIAKLDQMLQSVFLDMFGHPLANNRLWPSMRIGDVCSPKQWPTITGKQLEPNGYPVYGANGVIGFYSSYNHEVPTVLVTCRGATCGTINVCEAPSYVTGNAMALDNLDDTKIKLDYLAAMLRLRSVDEAITGAAQPQITREKLSPVMIPVPPLSEQSRFARISESISGKRAEMRTHADGIDKLFSSLQHRAFSGTL